MSHKESSCKNTIVYRYFFSFFNLENRGMFCSKNRGNKIYQCNFFYRIVFIIMGVWQYLQTLIKKNIIGHSWEATFGPVRQYCWCWRRNLSRWLRRVMGWYHRGCWVGMAGWVRVELILLWGMSVVRFRRSVGLWLWKNLYLCCSYARYCMTSKFQFFFSRDLVHLWYKW